MRELPTQPHDLGVEADDAPPATEVASPPRLSDAERTCLELAWEALGRATVPVGAVLVDPGGAIAATGRGRMYERSAPPGELAGSLLAHAEVNALVKLDPERRYEDWLLVSSLEPCPLCLGATVMSTVGRLTYLGADPYGGAIGLLAPTAHTARVPLRVTGPRDDLAGALAAALHVAFYLRRNPRGEVVRVHREQAPSTVRQGEALVAAGCSRRADAGEPFGRVEGELWELLSSVA